MTGSELEVLRRLLFFSVSEAAEHVGNCRDRSWRKWESGERRVPCDIAQRMDGLVDWRDQAISAMVDSIESSSAESSPKSIVLIWYPSESSWMTMDGRDPALFRPQCSVIAEIAAGYGCSLVQFDPALYFEWLHDHGYKDSEQMRGQWAASQK